MGFANSIRTVDGGTHMDGLKTAVTRTINSLGACALRGRVGVQLRVFVVRGCTLLRAPLVLLQLEDTSAFHPFHLDSRQRLEEVKGSNLPCSQTAHVLKPAQPCSPRTAGKRLKVVKDSDPPMQGDHIREGLSAIVSVKVCETVAAGLPHRRRPHFPGCSASWPECDGDGAGECSAAPRLQREVSARGAGHLWMAGICGHGCLSGANRFS